MIRLGDKDLSEKSIKLATFQHREHLSNAVQSPVFCTFAEFKPLNASRRTRLIRRLPRASAHECQETSSIR